MERDTTIVSALIDTANQIARRADALADALMRDASKHHLGALANDLIVHAFELRDAIQAQIPEDQP